MADLDSVAPDPGGRWTFGGLQLASDVRWHAGWRVQRLALSGRHRLLDPADVQRESGSLERCVAALERLSPGLDIPPEHVVLLLHGLGRTRGSMGRLARAVEAAGLTAARLSLATTRAPLERHAGDLGSVLAGLAARRVSFITHSLGGIVLRAALAEPGALAEGVELGRAVLIAPPNQGSALSRRLCGAPLAGAPFRWVLGPSGVALGRLEADLPPPPCPFAIVAGARGTPRGWNPLIEGDDDGIVTVTETRLAGAADHLVVRRIHTVVMHDRRVAEAAVRFLREGRLRAGPQVTDPSWPPTVQAP